MMGKSEVRSPKSELWVVGIDPAPDGQHTAAVLDPAGDIIWLDKLGTLPLYEHGAIDPSTEALIVIELPHFQGRGWANLLPVYKQAVMLITRFCDAGCRVHSPSPADIRSEIAGRANASDAEILAFLRDEGVKTGRGTLFTHKQSCNADAYLAALWGRWLQLSGPSEADPNLFREPRS